VIIAVLLLCFVAFAILTVPIAFAVAFAAFLAYSSTDDTPVLVMPQQMFAGTDSFVLLALPLFILAGQIMEKGGISERLMQLANVIIGHVRGGLAMGVVVGTMFFSGTTGSKLAEASALGAVALPGMKRAGYRPEMSVSVIASASAMGELIPPALLMVVIASIANLSVAKLFAGGFLPAMTLALLLMVVIFVQAGHTNMARTNRPTGVQFFRTVLQALLPLGLPFVIFGSIFTGLADPTEAAALAVVYALVLSLVIYRSVKLRELPQMFVDSAVTTGVIILMVGAASAASWLLAEQNVPSNLAAGMVRISTSPVIFFVLTTLVFVVLGSVLEGVPAVIICMPIFLPIAINLHIDPLHYAIVVVAAIGLGLFIPPFGAGYLIVSRAAGIRPEAAIRTMLPYIGILLLGMLVLIVVPAISLTIPGLLPHK